MAFEYLGSGTTVNLFNMIFVEILKISPTLLGRYTALQDQVIYLILIPSVIILMFIYVFGFWFVGSGNRGIRLLISAIAYIYIVYSGWYGSFIIPIILAWFPIVLISFFAFFILIKIFHPSELQGASKVMSATFKKATEKTKEVTTLEKQIELIDKKIRQLESEESRLSDDRAKATLIDKISELKHKKMDMEDQLDRLGG